MRFLEDDNLVLTLDIFLLLVMGSEQCTRNESERTGLWWSAKFSTGSPEAWSALPRPHPSSWYLVGGEVVSQTDV